MPGLDGTWNLTARLAAPPEGVAAPLGGAFGRGGVLRCGDLVLRPYRRGGLARFVNERTYASPSRFQREFAIHLHLWRGGFPTLEPVGFAWRRRGWGVEGVYLTRWVEALPWPRCWAREGVAAQVRSMVQALAQGGLWSPDLNATNILVEPDGHALALDWDKARQGAATDLVPRYVARLLPSLRKLGAPLDLQADVASWTCLAANEPSRSCHER